MLLLLILFVGEDDEELLEDLDEPRLPLRLPISLFSGPKVLTKFVQAKPRSASFHFQPTLYSVYYMYNIITTVLDLPILVS